MPLRSWFLPSDLGGHTGRGAAAAVAAIGVVATLGVAGLLRAEVRAEAQDALAIRGEALARSVEHDAQLVIEQVRGLRGLFEASVVVTDSEFELFSHIVGFSPSSVLMFATRQEGPDGTLSWSVSHLLTDRSVGRSVGDDLSESRIQGDAIAFAVLTGQPTVSGFIALDGDAVLGDVGVFQTVTTDGRVVGVVAAFVQLDERVAEAADDLLSPGESWEFEESMEDPGDVSTPYEWGRSLVFGGRSFRLSITSDRLVSAESQRPLGALIAGALITGLAARLVLDSQRRRRTDREIEWLRRSSADKDRFLAGVGHELRTPLTVVVGMLDLAADPGRELTTDERAELLATARLHAQDIARIVDDFVAAGRLSADTLTVRSQPTDLDPLVAKLIAAVPVSSRLELKTETGLGICLGDGLRITQILLNLLDNARRNAQLLVEIAGHSDDQFVTLEVRNDGPAIPTDVSDGLFEPFMTVRPEGQPQPVGLGLSVSRALARRMGGDLTYRWQDRQVVFSLTLPSVPAPLAVGSPAT